MAWSFNPFTGNLDLVGGGAVVFEGEVETFDELPETIGDPAVGASYLVRTSTGVWLVNRRQSGIWIRKNDTGVRATDWEYGGDYPVNSVNGQTGNVSLTAADVGVDFAAPPSIGNVTPNSGSFTTLTAAPAANTTALTSTGYSLTGSNAQSLVDLAGTWNTTGVPIAFKTNLTVTAAGANSMYADFQAGGYSQFGVARISGTSNALWLYNSNSGTNTNGVGANHERGFMRWTSNTFQIGTEKLGTGSRRPLELVTDGAARWKIGDGSVSAAPSMLAIGNVGVFGTNEAYNVVIATGAQGTVNAGVFSPNQSNTGYLAIGESLHLGLLANGSSGDVRLVRDAANILGLRNAASAQTFRLYTTYGGTGGADYERLFIRGQTLGAFQIGTEKGGTGAARALELSVNGNRRIYITDSGQVGIGSTTGSLASHGLFVDVPASNSTLTSGGVTIRGTTSVTLDNGGNPILRVASNRVGINTSSPTQTLHVQGNALITSPSAWASGQTATLYFGDLGHSLSVPFSTHAIWENYNGIVFKNNVGTPLVVGAGPNTTIALGGNITSVSTYAGASLVVTTSTATFKDAMDIAVGTTTGTKIGTATTQKLGFFDKTPVVQPTAVADATDAATVITQLNALLSRMRDLGLIAT